ncbi:MAG: xanthine phosphoribosyltransferase [Candidatus Promineifilaceae bacterium]
MQRLIERVQNEAVYLGRGIIKVDGFLNHQIDPSLTAGMGHAFAEAFTAHGVSGITKIVTAEVSGIAPAVATGMALGVPVVYARKKRPITMADGYFSAEAPSRTKGNVVKLMISPEYLKADDQVLIIDDFLATGLTIDALVDVVSQSGATLHGIGCVIEKAFTDGRAHLAKHHVPVVSLAKIDLDGDEMRVF